MRLSAVLCVVATLLAGGCSRSSFKVPEPVVPAAQRPDVFPDISTVGVDLALSIPALQAKADGAVDEVFSGVEDDPSNLLSDDTLRWEVRRGKVELSAGSRGELQFRIPIASASATLRGRLGIRRGSSGLLGDVEGLLGKSFSQTAQLGGMISGSVSPKLQPDWTIDPQLSLDIALDKAEARLFGQAIKISLRGEIERAVRPKLMALAARANEVLRREARFKKAVASGWSKLHAVTMIAPQPRIWFIMTPTEFGASDPVIESGVLHMRFVATLKTALSAQTEPPLRPALADLPPPGAPPSGAAGFSLGVPVSVRLSDGRPDGWEGEVSVPIPGTRAMVKLSNMLLSGDNGRLVIGVDIEASHPSMRRTTRGRVYMIGTPKLDPATFTLSAEDLDYSVETRNALVGLASWLVKGPVLKELRKKAVFTFASGRQALLAQANAKLAEARSKLPAGFDVNLQLSQVDLAGLVVDDGWATVLLTASGPASVTLNGDKSLLP
jgi:hypothetical protein